MPEPNSKLVKPHELVRPHNHILYLDLNSCFATIEQQARPMLRHKPVAVCNRLTPNACIIAASYEAKALGIKVGMRRFEATQLCPQLVFIETEPDKYSYVHHKFRAIMQDYSPAVYMKSIDEGLLDLDQSTLATKTRSHANLVAEIKQRLKNEIGCYMRCNIGIASNCFLAKLAAELHKPDGFDEITADNQRAIFATLKLQDLPGINHRMTARLNAVNIFTPLQLLDADELTLAKMVWRSVDGNKWYLRLRGIEVDSYESAIKSIGRQYVMESCQLNRQQSQARLFHLAEDLGRRLRSKHLYARGVYVWSYDYADLQHHQSILLPRAIHTDQDLMRVTSQLFKSIPIPARIIGITLYKLQSYPDQQLCFNHQKQSSETKLCQAADQINQRFGARVIHFASSSNTDQVKTKIPFGSTRYLECEFQKLDHF